MTSRCATPWPFARATLIAVYATAARADDVPVALEWNVPNGEQCPSAGDVMVQVTKLIGAGKRAERARIVARADVRKVDDGRFRVELSTVTNGSEGHRVIEEKSCKAMAEATAVILAWMVDPNAVEAPERTEEPKPEA